MRNSLMQVLIAAATEMEIAPFLDEHPSADILVTGVGIPAAIYHLTKRIQLIDYDIVIQAGIAGSFDQEIKTGTVVAVKSDTFADAGIRYNKGFVTLFEEKLANPDQHPFQGGWLVNDNLSETFLPEVNGVTVNMINEDVNLNEQIKVKFNAAIESMEGACLHYVCLVEDVKFLQLRAISNYIGERDKSKWNMELALKNLNKELSGIYKSLLVPT